MTNFLQDLSGGSDQSSGSGLNGLPQWASQAFQNLYNQAQGVSQNTANYAPIPFNNVQQGALNNITNGPPALGFTKAAQAAFGGAQDMANQVPGQINQANNYLGQANSNIAQGTQMNSPGAINNSINSFMNPYIQDAITPAVNNINMEGNYLGSQIAGQAANLGAFGGTRQAVAEGLNNYNTQQEVGNEAGTLLNQGYNTASQEGLSNLQNERQNFLTGAGLNVSQANGALSGANAYSTGANALTNLGNSNLQGWNDNINNYYTQQNQGLNAGNILQQPALQTQQIPFNQLQTLMTSLGALPQTSQASGNSIGSAGGSSGGASGLGSILGGIGSLAGAFGF